MSDPLVVPAPDWTMRLLPPLLAEHRIQPLGVLHVGAHHGEEVPTYLECGFSWVSLVEPDPRSRAVMATRPWSQDPRVRIFPVACTGRPGPVRFHLTDGGAWSGMKPSQQHRLVGEIWVPAATVASLQLLIPANVLIVDAQGTEMDALGSADLDPLDLIVVETQVEGVDGAHPSDLAAFAVEHGWRAAVVWDRGAGWTDTALVRA